MSKLRRRLTVQGDSENIDGGALGLDPRLAGLSRPKPKNNESTDDVRFHIDICQSNDLCHTGICVSLNLCSPLVNVSNIYTCVAP